MESRHMSGVRYSRYGTQRALVPNKNSSAIKIYAFPAKSIFVALAVYNERVRARSRVCEVIYSLQGSYLPAELEDNGDA